jgi:hypothetical protein
MRLRRRDGNSKYRRPAFLSSAFLKYPSVSLSSMERSVFFEGAVPVRLQQYDREERVADLTVHVLQAASGAGRTASLRFQLSDEADPFFYYWMEIDEESFQALKSEQCIMVDFSTFPSKVVEMLEASKSSSFECRVIVTSSSSRFEIVETNAFKKIVHLSLIVAHGDDAEVKKYLADKWMLTKNSLLQTTQQHEQLVDSTSVQIQQLVSTFSRHSAFPCRLLTLHFCRLKLVSNVMPAFESLKKACPWLSRKVKVQLSLPSVQG